ncbi:C6 zinc finger domain-containing protein [Colletotrichum tofieldiae]|nr:C6 zinc finger domain-containing protein [Colletotrichum tofieldiae]
MDGRSSVLAVLKNASWARQGVMEPLLVRAVDFKETIHSVKSSTNIREASITEMLQTGLGIIRDLEAAANYRIMSPGPRKTPGKDGTEDEDLNNFNNLLGRNSAAGEAIVRALYLTVRLHVIEYILSLSIALGELTRKELSILASLPHGLTALEQVCEQIRVVFGFDGREPACKDHGIGFNVWCMFWPMIAVLKSGFTDRDTKLWVMDKCSLVSQASGFGMAMYQMGWFEQGSVEMGTVG